MQSSEVDATTREFTWNTIPCGNRGGVINRYTYQLRNNHIDDVIINDVTDTRVLIDSLVPGMEYRFRVAARTGAGIGVYSNDTIVSVPLTGKDTRN